MRLTRFSDLALRVLLLAATDTGRLITIEQTARALAVSRSHLKKVVLMLAHEGYLESRRGRSGGFALARAPHEINLGTLIRQTEPDFALVECNLPDHACNLVHACALPPVLGKAARAFLDVLDCHTLADIRRGPVRVEARGAAAPRTGPVPSGRRHRREEF